MQKMEEFRATGSPSPAKETESATTALQDRADRAPHPEPAKAAADGTTPCPACTLVISVDINRCPHCSSDVAAHMALLRERMRAAREARSTWVKIRGYFSDPSAVRDLRVAAPALVVVFGLVAALRMLAVPPAALWGTATVSAILAHLALQRAGVRRPVQLDIYRTALLVGLAALLGGALF